MNFELHILLMGEEDICRPNVGLLLSVKLALICSLLVTCFTSTYSNSQTMMSVINDTSADGSKTCEIHLGGNSNSADVFRLLCLELGEGQEDSFSQK